MSHYIVPGCRAEPVALLIKASLSHMSGSFSLSSDVFPHSAACAASRFIKGSHTKPGFNVNSKFCLKKHLLRLFSCPTPLFSFPCEKEGKRRGKRRSPCASQPQPKCGHVKCQTVCARPASVALRKHLGQGERGARASETLHRQPLFCQRRINESGLILNPYEASAVPSGHGCRLTNLTTAWRTSLCARQTRRPGEILVCQHIRYQLSQIPMRGLDLKQEYVVDFTELIVQLNFLRQSTHSSVGFN